MLAGPWYVQHAVIGTGAIMYIFKMLIVAAHLKTFFNLVSINLTEGLMIPACPSLVSFLKKGITYSENLCLVFLYGCFIYFSYLCLDWFCRFEHAFTVGEF